MAVFNVLAVLVDHTSLSDLFGTTTAVSSAAHDIDIQYVHFDNLYSCSAVIRIDVLPAIKWHAMAYSSCRQHTDLTRYYHQLLKHATLQCVERYNIISCRLLINTVWEGQCWSLSETPCKPATFE